MEMNKYQELSKRTMPPATKDGVTNYVMGLTGEAGEVSELFKKHLYHGHKMDYDKLTEELGDVFHYLSGLCTMHGLKLGDVAEANLYKLARRYKGGFTQEESINRTDINEPR